MRMHMHMQALETLQKLKKEKTQESKEMKLKLETLKSHKDVAQKLQQQLHDGNTKAFDLEANIAVVQVRGSRRQQAQLPHASRLRCCTSSCMRLQDASGCEGGGAHYRLTQSTTDQRHATVHHICCCCDASTQHRLLCTPHTPSAAPQNQVEAAEQEMDDIDTKLASMSSIVDEITWVMVFVGHQLSSQQHSQAEAVHKGMPAPPVHCLQTP